MPSKPSSLRAWRMLEVGLPAQTAWAQFEPFFEQHSYKLFVPDTSQRSWGPYPFKDSVAPAGCSAVRREDEYNRFLPECFHMPRRRSMFRPQTGIHVAARSPTNTDVVIRIMAIGDEGLEHLAIMRALALPDAQVPENRTVPMVAELQKDDVIFGVFPMMWPHGMIRPWFKTVRELLDALDQVLEGFTYLHQRLIAHRDFSLFEVFANYGRGWDFSSGRNKCVRIPHTFRSVCHDLRYLINDFELSVQFTPGSDPQTRLVTGVPIARYGRTAKEYAKPLAPEARSDSPYCPFKADVYQIGRCALNYYRNINNVAGLQGLFVAMSSDDPDARPTAAQALATLRAIRQQASQDDLDEIPEDRSRSRRRLSPGETCTCSVCTTPKILGAYDLNLPSSSSQVNFRSPNETSFFVPLS